MRIVHDATQRFRASRPEGLSAGSARMLKLRRYTSAASCASRAPRGLRASLHEGPQGLPLVGQLCASRPQGLSMSGPSRLSAGSATVRVAASGPLDVRAFRAFPWFGQSAPLGLRASRHAPAALRKSSQRRQLSSALTWRRKGFARVYICTCGFLSQKKHPHQSLHWYC